MGKLLTQRVGLAKKEENGIGGIYGQQWAVPAISIWVPFISLPISVISPHYQYSQPESHILGTFTLMTMRYLWGLEIRILKSSHSKSPLTAWNLFALVDTVTIPANTEIFALDLYFFFLFSRIQDHLWFLRLTVSYFTVG